MGLVTRSSRIGTARKIDTQFTPAGASVRQAKQSGALALEGVITARLRKNRDRSTPK
jgi:hypothetical protein